MIQRELYRQLEKYIGAFPITALLGSRQCGKSTLAKEFIAEDPEWIYLDMESPSDNKKLDDAELFFNTIGEKRVCIDEVQLRPELFPVLRSIIDEDRRKGRILLLGSASPELLRQGSETLAGRIAFLELTPFTLNEIEEHLPYRRHWLHGGFPECTLEEDREISLIWLQNFIRTYVERDVIPQGVRISPTQITRLLTMCAHFQGQVFNMAKVSESLGISRPTVQGLLDILQQTFIVRRLEPFEANVKKRLVKSPKLYIRDSGILHSLLDVESMEDLLGNPILGNSWEGYAIENILTKFPQWKPSFYRTSNGTEMDLVLTKGLKIFAFEFKVSLAPKLTKGFWNAVEDVKPNHTWVIIPEGDSYPIKENITVMSLSEFLTKEDTVL